MKFHTLSAHLSIPERTEVAPSNPRSDLAWAISSNVITADHYETSYLA